jgi:excisionase family DNA binding protein
MSDTQTLTTTEAARMAGVTVPTVRTWARMGAIAATKGHGRWAIDADSLRARIVLPALLRAERNVLDLSAFRDAKAAKSKAVELIEQGGIIPASRAGLYLAVSSDGLNTYLIDLIEGSCTCKGHIHAGHCFHAVAAALIVGRPTAAFAAAA